MKEKILVNEQTYDVNYFIENFKKICEEHHSKKKVLLFAMLIYDFTNPNVAKVLNDNDYWNSLNNISGSYLSLFRINNQSSKKKKIQKIKLNHTIDNLYDINQEYENPSISTEKIINKYFEEDLELTYPSILIFQINENKISDFLIIEIDEIEIEKTFIEIYDYFDNITKALKKINDDYADDRAKIFKLAKRSINSTKFIKLTKKKLSKANSIIEFLSAIFGFF